MQSELIYSGRKWIDDACQKIVRWQLKIKSRFLFSNKSSFRIDVRKKIYLHLQCYVHSSTHINFTMCNVKIQRNNSCPWSHNDLHEIIILTHPFRFCWFFFVASILSLLYVYDINLWLLPDRSAVERKPNGIEKLQWALNTVAKWNGTTTHLNRVRFYNRIKVKEKRKMWLCKGKNLII